MQLFFQPPLTEVLHGLVRIWPGQEKRARNNSSFPQFFPAFSIPICFQQYFSSCTPRPQFREQFRIYVLRFKLGLFSAQSKKNSYIVSNFQDKLIKLLVFRWTCWVSIFIYTRGQLDIFWIWGLWMCSSSKWMSRRCSSSKLKVLTLWSSSDLPLSPPLHITLSFSCFQDICVKIIVAKCNSTMFILRVQWGAINAK